MSDYGGYSGPSLSDWELKGWASPKGPANRQDPNAPNYLPPAPIKWQSTDRNAPNYLMPMPQVGGGGGAKAQNPFLESFNTDIKDDPPNSSSEIRKPTPVLYSDGPEGPVQSTTPYVPLKPPAPLDKDGMYVDPADPDWRVSFGGYRSMGFQYYHNIYTGESRTFNSGGQSPVAGSGWVGGRLPSNFKPQKRPQMATTNPTTTNSASSAGIEARNAPIIDIVGRQAVGPVMPPGTAFVGAGQTAQANQFVNPATTQVAGTAPTANIAQVAAPSMVTAPTTLTTPQVSSTAVGGAFGAVDAATQAAPTQVMGDVTGTVSAQSLPQAAIQDMDEQATVQYQLSELYKTIESGKPLPGWASGAARSASQVMQQRGLGSSSMAAAAIAQSVMEGAMPIAAADAQSYQRLQLTNLNNEQAAALQSAATYAGMDTANLNSRLTSSVNNAKNFLSVDLASLSNKQASNTVTFNAKVQGMFTDQAQENAKQQFNAKNEIQVEEFFAQLGTQVDEANANRTAAVDQFNAGQTNALSQFNSTLQDSRDKFNSNMLAQIEQSNAQWRRQISTANTATQNEVNRTNAQALLGLSVSAQNNLWQTYRDEASWLIQVTERAIDRAHQIAVVAQKADIAEDMQYSQNMSNAMGAIGKFGLDRIFPKKG